MKKALFLLVGIFPILLFAQNTCDFFDDIEIKIEKTEVNTVKSDFGPSIVKGELWFSAYSDDEIKKMQRGKGEGIFYNLYSSRMDEDGNPFGIRNIELENVYEGYHAGPVTYCEETKELFVTLSNFDNPDVRNTVFKKAEISLKIIILKETDGIWKISEELPFNSSSYSVGQPAVTKSGNKLIFASNVPGKGRGGTDLFMAERENGKWSEMKNLGRNINTSRNEMFPFLINDEVLVYASNGMLQDRNDLDLYYSCFENGEFSEPKALDSLNSMADDFGLVMNNTCEYGYFSSAREGGEGDDDIYKVVLGEDLNCELELMVLDRETSEPVTNSNVSFSDDVEVKLDGTIFRRELKKGSKYTVTAEAEGYLSATKEIAVSESAPKIVKEVILIDKIEENKIIALENIYYDFNKWEILSESETQLNHLVKLMNDYPEMKIELRSHTDSRGSDEYNEILSQKRSNSAVEYILGRGINNQRIVAKGYGEKELLNECVDGVSCTDEEHRINRRTEFKILELGN